MLRDSCCVVTFNKAKYTLHVAPILAIFVKNFNKPTTHKIKRSGKVVPN